MGFEESNGSSSEGSNTDNGFHLAEVAPDNSNGDPLRDHLRRIHSYETDDLSPKQLADIRSLVARLESGEQVPEPISWDEYQIDTRGFTDAEALEYPMPKFVREVLYAASIGVLEENEEGEVLTDVENLILQKLASDPDAFSIELREFFTKSLELRTINRKSLFLTWIEKFYSEILGWEQLVLDVEDSNGHLAQQEPEKFARITMGTGTLARTLVELCEEDEIDGFSKMRLFRLVKRISNADESLRTIDHETEIDDERPFEIAPGKFGAVVKGRLRVVDSTPELKKECQDWNDLYNQYADNSDLGDGGHTASLDDLMTRLDSIHEQMEPLQFSDIKLDSVYDDSMLSNAAHLEDIFDLSELLLPEMRCLVQESFGIELNQCSLSEQFDILGTLKSYSSRELQPIQDFSKKFSTEGFRTILSLRFEGDSFSNVILQFAQENPEQARVVFGSYSGLLNRLDDISKVIKREVRCKGEDCEELIRAAEERLFHKTHLYLKKAIAEQNTASIKKIGDSAAAGVVLSASLQAALESGAVSSVRELEGFRQDVVSGPDLMQDIEFIDRLKEIYRHYYQHYKDGGASLIEQFEQRLASQDTKVHLWRVGDEVLAFALATEQSNTGEVYVSALNVNPALKEAKAGVGLVYEMDQYLEDGKCVVAEATVDNAVGYCKFGYVITDWMKDPDEGFVFRVRKQSDWHFPSQQEKSLHLAKYVKENNLYEDPRGFRVIRTTDPTPPDCLGKDCVITNVITLGRRPKQYIYVLDQIPTPVNDATAPQINIAA